MNTILPWALKQMGDAPKSSAESSHTHLDKTIMREVAARWNIRHDTVAIRYETPIDPMFDSPAAFVRLLGDGRDGHFIVSVEIPGVPNVAARIVAGTHELRPYAKTALAQDSCLAERDIKWCQRIKFGPPGKVSSSIQPGWSVLRPVSAGQPLDLSNTRPPSVISDGDRVRVEWRQQGVALAGVAMKTAGIGEPLTVKLVGRSRRVQGTVVGRGVVQVGFLAA